MDTYDFVIIGAGPAGEAAAHKARELDASVAVIDRRFPLEEAGAALEYLGGGHARGKVVVTLEPAP